MEDTLIIEKPAEPITLKKFIEKKENDITSDKGIRILEESDEKAIRQISNNSEIKKSLILITQNTLIDLSLRKKIFRALTEP